MILDGFSNKEIAKKMYLTERTIKFHCTNLYKKHGVENRIQLISLLFNELKKESLSGD